MSINESKLWKLIKEAQKGQKKWHFFRLESSTINGIPDVHACMDNKPFWIELKAINAKNKGLSKWQWNWHIDYQRAGGKSFILNAYDKESKLEVLVIREPRSLVELQSYSFDHNHIATITKALITMSQS